MRRPPFCPATVSLKQPGERFLKPSMTYKSFRHRNDVHAVRIRCPSSGGEERRRQFYGLWILYPMLQCPQRPGGFAQSTCSVLCQQSRDSRNVIYHVVMHRHINCLSHHCSACKHTEYMGWNAIVDEKVQVGVISIAGARNSGLCIDNSIHSSKAAEERVDRIL